MRQAGLEGYELNPDDPRAPTSEQWAAMSSDERRRVIDALPTSLPIELHPPEGDVHRKVKQRAVSTLGDYFHRARRRLYVSSELVVFYPGERSFVPDVMAVLDVDPHDRTRWVVDDEGKGIDFVLEVLVGGQRSKDLRTNVERYARLGIREYFVFDEPRATLHAFRLNGRHRYEPILPQQGLFASQVLELDVAVHRGTVRFFANDAALEGLEERVVRLGSMVDDVLARATREAARAEQEAQRAEQEAQRAEQEAQRAEREAARARAAEERLAVALAEIERLKGR